MVNVQVGGDQVLPCPSCGVPMPHRPTPPDGYLRCRRCVPDGPAAAPPKERGHIKVPIKTLVLVAILVIAAGFTHIVHGGSVGLTVCAKDGWSLSDTFVDLDDYIGKPLLANIDKAKVLRAMFACGALEKPAFMNKR